MLTASVGTPVQLFAILCNALINLPSWFSASALNYLKAAKTLLFRLSSKTTQKRVWLSMKVTQYQ
jgi:hypothetical protein